MPEPLLEPLVERIRADYASVEEGYGHHLGLVRLERQVAGLLLNGDQLENIWNGKIA